MTATTVLLVFPHQLFADHPALAHSPETVAIIEDSLFFGDRRYPAAFHKQKLWFHRSSMTRYAQHLRERGVSVTYVEHDPTHPTLGGFLDSFAASGGARVVVADPHDFMLKRRLERACERLELALMYTSTPMFLNTSDENQAYRKGKKRWFMADFYKFQRRRLDVLMDGDEPVGGKWSLDHDNRKKVPKKLLSQIPALPALEADEFDEAARHHVRTQYASNPGSLDTLWLPTSHDGADRWLRRFVQERFQRFGDYEDALVEGESFLWHSVLTPMLNTGLLTPQQVLDAALHAPDELDIPLNSVEGFVRQIIGWREFMRATYEEHGVTMRNGNHWNHHRPLSKRFYDGTTGIDPIDDSIRRIVDTGYGHHIERLMVLGGFMFLCEFDPNDIYRWFMEMFVDSYDWVMVPNVYAMSQHADGGLITTKPYFSGSAYIRKMGNYKPGPWTATWDGLYWRWILKHSESLAKNPRWAMMCAMGRRMSEEKQAEHIRNAEAFLATL